MIVKYDFFDERYPELADDEYSLMESYDGIFDDYIENSIIVNLEHPKYGQLLRDFLFRNPIFAKLHGWFPFDNSGKCYRMIITFSNPKDKETMVNLINGE